MEREEKRRMRSKRKRRVENNEPHWFFLLSFSLPSSEVETWRKKVLTWEYRPPHRPVLYGRRRLDFFPISGYPRLVSEARGE